MINQMGLVILAIMGGFVIALFYDLYWLKIAYRRRPLFKAIIQDLVFWLIILILFAALWFYLTSGIMRLAIYFWLLLGIIAQRLSLAPYFAKKRKRRPLAKELLAKSLEQPNSTNTANAVKGAKVGKANLSKMPQKAMLKSGLIFWQNYQKGLAQSQRFKAGIGKYRQQLKKQLNERLKWRQKDQFDDDDIEPKASDNLGQYQHIEQNGDDAIKQQDKPPLTLAEQWQMHISGKVKGRKIRFK